MTHMTVLAGEEFECSWYSRILSLASKYSQYGVVQRTGTRGSQNLTKMSGKPPRHLTVSAYSSRKADAVVSWEFLLLCA